MINFGSSLRVGALKGDMEITGKEKQVPPVFHRERGMQAVTTTLCGVKLLYCQANNSKIIYLAPSGESCRNIMMARYVNLLLLILLRVIVCL